MDQSRLHIVYFILLVGSQILVKWIILFAFYNHKLAKIILCVYALVFLVFRKVRRNVAQRMSLSRILIKCYRWQNQTDDQQLASVCVSTILDTLVCSSFSFFLLTKKKNQRQPRSSAMTHLSLRSPSFFFFFFFNRTKPM